ncbi:MAG TPA: lysylphosphatidylglycerol synthase transmembrane domain-containing protein [Pyrinomonadaceae bacterium]|nr:lysylphosphatidylglycerol synthase transmembrane domain-containing protein [Pyrinomonadaceae bacterium]
MKSCNRCGVALEDEAATLCARCAAAGEADAAVDAAMPTPAPDADAPTLDADAPTSAPARSQSRRLAPAGALFALLGLALFVYVVWRAGVGEIWNDIRRLGAGFVVIIALSGLRFVVRAFAWTLCFERPHALRFRDAFRAYLTGDAVGNVLPLGIVVSEPTKVYFVRDRVPLVAAMSAIAVENIFYSLSVALFVFSGAAALLLLVPVTSGVRWTALGILSGVAVVIALGVALARAELRVLSGVAERLYARGVGRRVLETRRVSLRALEDRVYGFYARSRRRFLPILLLELSFHLLGVAEAYVTLSFISDAPPTVLAAFVLESVNRVINVVFKFVPMRVGVDEAGTGWITRSLRLGTSTGVTLAIVRKARMLFWTAIGIAFLVGRGLSVRAVARDAERAIAESKLSVVNSE